MDERAACALLKARFEAAGFRIEENRPFAEAGVSFEIDGYDPARRVGYEYVTSEAGDGWDVDAGVIETLAAQRANGLFVLIVDETDAPDPESLTAKADAFLAELPPAASAKTADESTSEKPAGEPAKKRRAEKAAKKPVARKPAAKKPKPVAKKR